MLFGKHRRLVKRILIVEDEPLTAFDTEVVLQSAKYEVVGTVDRYADAIKLLDDGDVDLLLSDIRLAGERSGIDLAREAAKRDIPVLFISGDPPQEMGEAALGYLHKPYADKTLVKALGYVDKLLQGETPKPVKGLTLYTRENA